MTSAGAVQLRDILGKVTPQDTACQLRFLSLEVKGKGYTIPEDPCMPYLPAYIYHKHHPNVGRYTIHGPYGNVHTILHTCVA